MTLPSPPTPGTEATSADALAAQLLAQLQRRQAARVSELGEEPLAWLAVAPLWTDRLARACGFPERPLPLDEFLTRAEAAGWCAQRPGERRARPPHLRLQIQAELFSHLSASEQRATLDSVFGIEDEAERAAVLARLVPNLPDELLTEVTDAARESTGAAFVPVLLALVARAEEPWRSSLAPLLVDRIGEIEDPEDRAARMIDLGRLHPYPVPLPLTSPPWEQLVAAQEPPFGRSRREELICWLAGRIPPKLVEQEVGRRLAEGEPVAAARLLRAAGGGLHLEATIHFLDELTASIQQRPAGAERDLALADLLVAGAVAGDGARCLALVGEIVDPRIRVSALTEARYWEALLDPWAAALETNWTTAATQPDGTLDLVAVARLVERLGSTGAEERVLSYARLAAAQSESAAPSTAVVSALQQIAWSLSRSLQMHEAATLARRLLATTARLAQQLGDPVARASALTSTAGLRGTIRRVPAVVALTDPALIDAVQTIYDEEERLWALVRLVPVVAERIREDLINQTLALATQLSEASGTVTFWIPEGARGELLAELQRRRGFAWLRSQVAVIARSVFDARQRVATTVPPALARWAELAADAGAAGTDGSTREAAARLDQRLEALLDAGDTGQALTWLDTAKALSPLLGGEFEVSVLANTRRVELVHRRWLDRRRLERFLHRGEQIVAFESLMRQPAGEDAPWALHYLGVGGVGKTMLIRYLTAIAAPAINAVTSRIDFDHLNPDFPRRRPAQILVELAAELQAQAQDSRLDYLFRRGWEYLQEINARARPASVTDDDFAAALRSFAGFLQALDRPVLLVLDTCEELEKFRPAGGRLEQLEATFQILEALHQQVPTLRVVLAGRRPLARAGRGWRLPPGPAGQGNLLLPEDKPYLLLHEIRGFDRTEAEQFLTIHAGLRADPELLTAILARSPDPGSAADLRWDDGHQPPPVPRYNPFDLDLYAGWVRAEPGLDVAALRGGGTDRYVEARIVGRLKNPEVERLLPAVIALRRFDRDMLRLAFDGDEDALADAERELAASEWIDVQPDAALDTTFLEVDRSLHPRLEAHYQREHAAARRRLAPGLAALMDSHRPNRLSVDHVAAALRMLDPADAARLVDRLAMRVIEDAAWGWAATVGERLLAVDSPLADRAHPAAAGLRAMLASALLHQDPDRDLAELWAVVEQTAANHPDPEVGEWLARRAFLKLLTPESGRERLAPVVASLREPGTSPEADRRKQILAGAALSALQDLLDLAEASGDPSQLPAHGVYLDVAASAMDTNAAAFAEMLDARSLLLRGDFESARAAFHAASGVDPAAEDIPLPVWLHADWEPPADLYERIWLEAIRNPPAVVNPAFLESDWALVNPTGGIDAERLASAILDRRLENGLVPTEVLEFYERFPDLYDARRPACEAHRAVPPLFVTLARAWMALGWPRRALAVLRQAESDAVEHRDQAAADAAALARLEVVRRFRLADEARPSRQRLLRSPKPADRWRAWEVGVLVDPPEELPEPRAGDAIAAWHAWWRAQPAANVKPSAARVLQLALHYSGRDPKGPEQRDFMTLSLELDSIEARWFAGGSPRAPAVVDARAWVANHPSQAEEAVRLALRQHVLCADAGIAVDHWTELLGPRRVAELALDEGELLALRLPAAATSPLELAERLFREAGDPTGGFVSLLAWALVAPSRRQNPELRLAYSALSADPAGPPLPKFDELTLGPTTTAPPYLQHPDWGGWLGRLTVIKALSSGLPGMLDQAMSFTSSSGPRSAEVLGPLSRVGMPPGTTGDMEPVPPPASFQPPPRSPYETPSFPAESPQGAPPQQPQQQPAAPPLAGSPAPPQAAPSPGPPPYPSSPSYEPPPSGSSPSAQAPTPARARRRWPLLVGPVAAMVSVLVAVLWLVASQETSTSAAGGGATSLGVWVAFGIFVGMVVVVVAVVLLWQWPRGRVRRLLETLALVEEVLWVDGAPPRGDDAVVFSSRKGAEFGRQPGFGPYAGQPSPRLWALGPRVGLGVSQELAPLQWEVLILPVMHRSLATRQRFCWREPDRLSTAGKPPSWQRRRPYTVLASPRWLPLLQANLGQVHADDDLPIYDKRARRPTVVVGTPVETSAGTQLLVEWPVGRSMRFLPEFPPGDAPGLIVVMGEPSESLTRVDAEREATADLRRCAADLFAGGAGAVLCLPSMPADLAGATLKKLDQRLQRLGRRRGRRALITTTAILRTLIERSVPKDGPPQDQEAARELALEVTLFVRGRPGGQTL